MSEARHSGHAGGMFVGPGEIREGPRGDKGGSLSLSSAWGSSTQILPPSGVTQDW